MLAPAFSGLTAYATYLLGKELGKDNEGKGGEATGLWAALFIGIAPGYISRSVAGSYDNEAIAIFILMFTFYLWIKALKEGSAMYGALTALFYFYMVAAWGRGNSLKYAEDGLIIDESELSRWLRIHHQHAPSTRLRPHLHGTVFTSSLCFLLHFLRHRYIIKHASSLRWFPAYQHLRALSCIGRFRPTSNCRIRRVPKRHCAK